MLFSLEGSFKSERKGGGGVCVRFAFCDVAVQYNIGKMFLKSYPFLSLSYPVPPELPTWTSKAFVVLSAEHVYR